MNNIFKFPEYDFFQELSVGVEAPEFADFEIPQIIGICAGGAGIEAYENMSLPKFIEWFERNIEFNSPKTKEQGQRLIKFLKRTKLK